jgi:peptidoglycan/LPS O-acetylase OafA/YrhL
MVIGHNNNFNLLRMIAATVIAVSLPATLCCATLSWHLIESPALAHRVAIAGWLERKLAQSAGRQVWDGLTARHSPLIRTEPDAASVTNH